MKIEKLNENKIKITLSIHDLEEKDINFHDFMSNSIESQGLFLDMLQEAEEKVGFKIRNCRVKIETLAMTEEDFILTITKVLPESSKKHMYASVKRKIKVNKKSNNIHSANLIYRFNSFDDYCNFIEYLFTNNLYDSYKIAEKSYVYLYNDSYYLVLYNICTQYKRLTTFYSAITEFGSYIINPDLFVRKLNESGNLFLKNNAFKKSFLYFSKK